MFKPRPKPIYGNIASAEFVENIGPRRLKHGGMRITFLFEHNLFDNAANDVEAFLESKGLVRGEHYNIPGWNKLKTSYDRAQILDKKIGGFYITFADDETFVMTKLSWDLTDEL